MVLYFPTGKSTVWGIYREGVSLLENRKIPFEPKSVNPMKGRKGMKLFWKVFGRRQLHLIWQLNAFTCFVACHVGKDFCKHPMNIVECSFEPKGLHGCVCPWTQPVAVGPPYRDSGLELSCHRRTCVFPGPWRDEISVSQYIPVIIMRLCRD